MVSPILAATNIFSVLTAVGITMCPAWISDQSGNLRGPLFSVIDGSWSITSLPAVSAFLFASLACSNRDNDDTRILILHYLSVLGGVMLSIMALPGLKLVPLFPSFFLVLAIILIALLISYFPHEKQNVMEYLNSHLCHGNKPVKKLNATNVEGEKENDKREKMYKYLFDASKTPEEFEKEFRDYADGGRLLNHNDVSASLGAGGYDPATEEISDATLSASVGMYSHVPIATPVNDTTIPGTWRGFTFTDK